ncbi:conserved hypothetical protein [Ixodes scapularis]|uniref:Uncharacterized protein n=1 Tax=Ixodes scapularis TaxID=6945 RepID=B7P984_IXOSC|nr:conserved hypothetical protein [Ixodes scapularis]|eukprot:XP_002403740.1 conserved hypothetical protein [Ixodes scapularis]
MPMATDLETTTISGYGYITVSNATTVVVYRSDELASNFRVFDILHGADLTDIALFRVGFESFLAIAGFKDQFLYVWRGGGFHLSQVFAIRDGFQWHPVALGSCRDDVLLTLATNDATYPMKLFAWSSELRQFMEIQRGTVPLGGFLALKDSLSSFSLKDNAWLFFTDALKGGAKSLMVSTKVVLLPNPVQEKGSQLVLRMRIAKLSSLVTLAGTHYVSASKSFAVVNVVKELSAHSVDGVDIVKAVATSLNVVDDQVASGVLKFTRDVHATSVFAPVLNGIDVSDIATGIVDDVPVFRVFAGRITLHSEQNITAEPLFLDTVRVGHLYTLGRIQGLLFPQDLVLKSVPQQVYGTKHMVHGLSAALLDSRIQVSVKGLVGGVDIVDIDRRRVTLSRHQEVSGALSIGNATMSSLNAVLMNGRPVQDFLQNVMSRTRPQVVTASKTFSGILKSSAPVSTMKGVNGVSLKLINTNAVGLRGQSVIGAPVAMKDIFVVLGKMSIRGMLDGRDLNTFEADTVPKRGWISVRGNCVFYGGLAVHGNIAAGDVNELMLSYDALLKSADQSIKGHYHFKKNVKVLGDLPHLGHVNGIDLSVLDMLVAKEDRENVIHSDLDIQNVASVETDINVEGLVNGHKLHYLKDRAICHARHHDIHGTKVIRGPVEFLNSLDVRHYDNRSLSALFNDIVLLDGHFTTAPKTFNDLLLEGSIKAKQAHLKGHVNGVALDMVLTDAVWINGKCELYACPYQQLHSPTFDELQVPGHVPVSDLVNGHNLPQALKNTLFVHSNQTVPGTKDLQSTVFTRNVLPRRVNGASFHQEVVTLETPQTVLTTIAPSNVIAPNVNVKGLINGIDFNKLVRDAVYLNVPQTIPAALELNTVVAQKNIKLVGTLNKVQLPQLHKDLSLFERAANQLATVMGQKIGEHEAVLDRLSCFLTDSYSSVDHFVLHQSLDVEATLVDAESHVYHLRLLDSHVGQPVAQAFHFGWSGADQRWHLETSVTSDEGRRIYFRLEGKLLWLEEPLPDSRAKRGILTDGTAVLYNFGDVHSMSAVAADATSAIVASLTKNGVLDVFSFTLQRSEPTIIGTINPGPGESGFGLVAAITVTQLTDVDLFVLEGNLYLIVAQGHSTDSTGKTIVYRAATQGAKETFRRYQLT